MSSPTSPISDYSNKDTFRSDARGKELCPKDGIPNLVCNVHEASGSRVDVFPVWQWATISALMACSFMIWFIAVAGTNLALPEIGRDMDIQPAAAQWIPSAAALTCCCGLLLAGRIADVFGSRNVFLMGLLFLCVGELVSGLVPSLVGLAVAQAVAGIGASLTIPSSLRIVGVCVPRGRYQGYAFAAHSAGAPFGSGVGVLISGAAITSGLGWRTLYRMIAGLVFALLLLSAFVVPPDPSKNVGQRIDWYGAGCVTLALFLVIFAFASSQTSAKGWQAPYVAPCLAFGVVLLVIFVWWQKRLGQGSEEQRSSVLMPLELFARGRGALATLFAAGAVMDFGSTPAFLLFPYYWSRFDHLSAAETSYRYCAGPITGTLTCVAVGVLQSKVPAKILICTGGTLTMVSFLLMATMDPSWGYWKVQWLAMSFSVIAIDTIWSVGTALVGDFVTNEEQGVTQAVFATSVRVGGTLGLSVSSIMASTFERAALRDLASPSVEELDHAVLQGLRAAFWLAAGSTIAATLIVLIALRHNGVAGKDKKT